MWNKCQPKGIEQEILGLHESATNLHSAVNHKDKDEINKRVASTLIGVLSIAKSLNVKDLELAFQNRMRDIKNQ